MALKYNNNSVRAISFVGSNLQPIKDWSERTINGVTCSIRDGVGYLNGTSTAGSWQQTEIDTIVLPAGTYTLYFWTNFVQTTSPQLLSKIGLGLRNTTYDNLYPCNTNKYRTFTLTEQQTFNIVFWWQSANMVFDNIWIKSMVKEGEYDPTTQYVAYDPTPKLINRLVYNNTVAWCRPIRFDARKTLDDNILTATFSSVSGVTVTKGDRDGYFTASGAATTTVWSIKQLKFTETGTYYVRNFNYSSSSDIVKCYLASFSTTSYPDNYWLQDSTLTFNITQANTTCNIILYVASSNVGKTINNQVLKIYVGKTNATSFDQSVTATPDDYTASIISTEEPSVTSVPKSIVNGNDTYYGSRVRFIYYVGVDRDVKTVSIPSSTTLNSPSITNSFQGSYGFTVYNPNSITCTGYWYAEYWDPLNPGPTWRVPSSGYNTFSVNANSNSSRQYVVSGSMQYVMVYVYLSGTRTTTTTTTYNNYDGTPTNLSDTSYNDTLIEDQLYSRTFVGTSDNPKIFILLNLEHWVKTSETSSSTTITSSTVSKSLTTS